MLDIAELPDDIAALKAMFVAAALRDQRKDERIAQLEKLVAAFKQAAFGRRSEKSDPDQFELAGRSGNGHRRGSCRGRCRKPGGQATGQTAQRQSWLTPQAPAAHREDH